MGWASAPGIRGGLLDWLLDPRSRHENDASTCADLSWDRQPLRLPAGLELEWLGAAGVRLSYQGTTILVDPYVSRPGPRALLGRQRLCGSITKVRRYVGAANAVLVGHTHFDHALDVPLIARQFACPVYGSPSLRHLMGLYGQAERAVRVEPYRPYEVGPFRFRFVPSQHSRLVLGLAVPAGGELTCNHLDRLSAGEYRCGQVWGIHIEVAGLTMYHQGSADLIDDAIRHRDVDIFFCGISGRSFARNYAARILTALEPHAVIPIHHDNFFRDLSEPMSFSFNVNLGSFVDEVRSVSSDITVCTIGLCQPVHG
jgi:L-ascorbate metabolism protein UlaG (beta-lactamase superfamily)